MEKTKQKKALETSKSLFSGNTESLNAAPTTQVAKEDVTNGLDILNLLIRCQLSTSRGEARKLIQGGGLNFNGEKLSDFNYKISLQDFENDKKSIMLRKGKKDYHLVTLM